MPRPRESRPSFRRDNLTRGLCDKNTLDISIRMCLPNAVANGLRDLTGVAEHAFVHDGDFHFTPLYRSITVCLRGPEFSEAEAHGSLHTRSGVVRTGCRGHSTIGCGMRSLLALPTFSLAGVSGVRDWFDDV
jgi:hypothetical protein